MQLSQQQNLNARSLKHGLKLDSLHNIEISQILRGILILYDTRTIQQTMKQQKMNCNCIILKIIMCQNAHSLKPS